MKAAGILNGYEKFGRHGMGISPARRIVIKYAGGPVRVVLAGHLTADQNHEILLKRRGVPRTIHSLCIANEHTLVFRAFMDALDDVKRTSEEQRNTSGAL